MEVAQEAESLQKLEALLDDGTPTESLEIHLKLICSRVMRDADHARLYLPALFKVADRGLATAELHVALFNCYSRAQGIEHNPAKALEHIHLAMEMGSKEAIWWYANALRNNKGLEDVLEQDHGKALRLYRGLADANDGSFTQSLALPYVIDMLIENKRAIDCSQKYIDAVDQYVRDGENWQIIGGWRLYAAARFYTDGLESADYAGREYAKARRLLLLGLKAGDEAVQGQCQRLLEEWRQMPISEPEVTFSSLSVAEKVTVFSIPFILIFWALVSSALLALVSAISIPFGLFLLAGLIVFGLSKLGKKQPKP